jgi:hypothetical protein
MSASPHRSRRSLLIIAVVALLAIPTTAIADHLFDDVSHGSTHEAGIAYVKDTGITQGCTVDLFCPTDNLTRQQMATFIHRQSGHAPGTPPSVNAASIAGVEHVIVPGQNVFGSAVNNGEAKCSDDHAVVGGGASGTSPTSWLLSTSRPLDDGSGWTARFVQKDGFLGVHTMTVYALCVPVGG